MPIKVVCPDPLCAESFVRPDEEAGREALCPVCGKAAAVPIDEAAWLPAVKLGAYRLIRKIAHGGMGEIYEAEHTRLERRAALKTLSPELSGDPDYLERFQREARAAAAVNHPNLVHVYDCGEEDGVHYLVMELVEGRDLARVVKKEGKLPQEKALAIAEKTALALREALENGIVHRDVKPGNILLSEDGAVKLADLGLAKVRNDDAGLTMTGVGLGSPHFIAPEQADDARNVDHRADIYSLGVTLLFLLTGRRPFEGGSAFSVVVSHANKPLPSGRELGTQLPEDVESLIRRMTEKQPEERYQDYDSLLADIRRIKGDPEVDRKGDRVVGAPLILAFVAIVGLLGILFASTFMEAEIGESIDTPPRPTPTAPPATGATRGVGNFTTDGLEALIARLRPAHPEMNELLPIVDEDIDVGFSPLPPVSATPLQPGAAVEMIAEADAFAEANTNSFKEILARYTQVKESGGDEKAATRAESSLQYWALRYFREFRRVFQVKWDEAETHLRNFRPRDARAVWLAFPEHLRSSTADRFLARVIDDLPPPLRQDVTPGEGQFPGGPRMRQGGPPNGEGGFGQGTPGGRGGFGNGGPPPPHDQ